MVINHWTKSWDDPTPLRNLVVKQAKQDETKVSWFDDGTRYSKVPVCTAYLAESLHMTGWKVPTIWVDVSTLKNGDSLRCQY